MKFDRINKLIQIMETFNLEGMAFNPGPTLTYLTGLSFHLMERPTVLLVTRTGRVAMVLPALEKGKLPPESEQFHAFPFEDDPATWAAAFGRAGEWLQVETGRVGVSAVRLRFLELKFIEAALTGIEVVDGQEAIGALRMKKDSDEINCMRKAAQIAQTALLSTLKTVKAGMTEKAIANELVIQLLKSGSDAEIPFPPIVAIGENSANPHAVPTDRALSPGDLLLVDWGASWKGYYSDITRTFTFGEVDPELLRIGEIVMAANQAGRGAGRTGTPASAVDKAARAVIEASGYGPAFIHRTGHGLGLEAHEAPYIYAENDRVLTSGMTFTVEPGIYLSGRGGVRVEDDVVVTEDGLESLTDLPRELLALEGWMA